MSTESAIVMMEMGIFLLSVCMGAGVVIFLAGISAKADKDTVARDLKEPK